jgi:hypothetical protein
VDIGDGEQERGEDGAAVGMQPDGDLQVLLRMGALSDTASAITANDALAASSTAMAIQKRTSRGPVMCLMGLRLVDGD